MFIISAQNYKKKTQEKVGSLAKNSPWALIFCEFIVLLHEEIKINKVKQAKNGNIFKTVRT